MTKDHPKEHPVQQFQGHMPYPPVDRIDDWGLNVEQQARAAVAGTHACHNL
jgi:hypothetical protein